MPQLFNTIILSVYAVWLEPQVFVAYDSLQGTRANADQLLLSGIKKLQILRIGMLYHFHAQETF